MNPEINLTELPGKMPGYFAGNADLENLYRDYSQGKISLSFIAKRIDKSKTTIGKIMTGKYEASPENILKSLARAANEWYTREKLLPLTSYKAVHATCDMAWSDMAINLIYSPAGYGKTEGLMSYAQKNQTYTIYYRVLSTDRPREVLDGIMFSLNIEDNRRISMSDRVRIIQEKLRMDPQLILIDEADQLRTNTLNIIREIWDDGNCAIVIAGLPRIRAILERGDDMLSNLAQLYRRVKFTTKLRPPTLEDIRLVVEKFSNIELTEPMLHQLKDRIANKGGLGTLTHILETADDFSCNHNRKADDEIVLNLLKQKLGM